MIATARQLSSSCQTYESEINMVKLYGISIEATIQNLPWVSSTISSTKNSNTVEHKQEERLRPRVAAHLPRQR
jgi:hypothetical protein